MMQKTFRNQIKKVKINLPGLVIIKLFIIIMLGVLTESVHAQGCSITLKIINPAPVCYPLTVDLTDAAITVGSTNGLIFSYYLNSELTIPLSSPAKAKAGTYYIKGVLTDPVVGFVAASVKVEVIEKPKLIIANPVVVGTNGSADLTLPQITLGSEAGLVFSYWYDFEAKNALLSPKTIGKGEYFIKGASANGCFDILPLTVNN